MKCVLGDIANVIMGQSPKSEFYNSEGQGTPFLQGNRTFGNRYPIFDTYTTKVIKKAQANDIIMSVRAPVGDLNFAPADICLGRGVCGIRMKNGNQDFLFYLLKYYMPQLLNKESGTIFGSVSQNDINGLEIEIPDSPGKQQRIARMLAMLDDKIELNNTINNNLEKQAQAIYVSMFITNADPSWKIGHLSDLIIVKYGKDHKKLADGKFPLYGSGGIMRYVERPLYVKESVLIPRKGTLNNVIYVNQPFWSVDTMFYTEMRLPNVAKFVYHFVKSKDLASMNAGSAVPSMTTDILNAMEVVIPSAAALKEFEEIVSPMYKEMQENDKQSTTLGKLRDTLLPKLMSGELDVSNVEL